MARHFKPWSRGHKRRVYYLAAAPPRTPYRRMWYATGMIKQSAWVGPAIVAAGGVLLASCGTSAEAPSTAKTVCSPRGGWCLVLRQSATSARVSVACPVRACSAATVALTKVARSGQAYPGPEVLEGLPAVTPGPTVTVAPARAGITCDAAFQAALGGWCIGPGETTHHKTTAGPGATAVATPTFSCSSRCQNGWAVVVASTAPGRPWALTLHLPAIRAPWEVAE